MFGFGKSKKTFVPAEPDRSTLVPRIKTPEFLAALQEMEIPADQMPYTEPLVADLLVAYAFDLPDSFQMANVSQIAELGLRGAEVREVALDNLRRQMPEVGYQDLGPFRQIVAAENLQACVLLANRFWEQVAEEMDGEIVAVVPHRDVLLFCSSRDEVSIQGIAAVAEEALSEGDRHCLSSALLVWRENRWTEWN